MLRVLIVDDQAGFRRHLRRLLAYAGWTVVGEAVDVTEAESQVQALRPDLAVVDVMLPGISGLDGTPRLKALLPEMRVILVSAHSNHADLLQRAATAAGAEAFVPKDQLDVDVVLAWKESYGGKV